MQRRRLTYHWVVFAAAFVVLLGAAGTRSTPGVLIDPLREEFGWSRATVGLAVSINVLLFGFIGPFAAALQQRYGLRRVTSVALLFMAAGAGLTTQMSHSWQLFLLWGVVVGAGSGCMATVFASTVASRWFIARRGIVTGALTAATASGQLVFLPLLTSLASQISNMQLQLSNKQALYYTQFNALSAAVASMTNTSTYLTTQLAAIANQTKSN